MGILIHEPERLMGIPYIFPPNTSPLYGPPGRVEHLRSAPKGLAAILAGHLYSWRWFCNMGEPHAPTAVNRQER